MATRAFANTVLPDRIDLDGVVIGSWSGLLNTDDGAPVELAAFADKSVQITGTLGVGGSIQLEGSMNGTDWGLLTDPQGNNIVKTALTNSIETITELVRYVRPRVTAGDGTTNFTVHLLARRARP